MLRAVLFDLDDTLFDHAGCARGALDAVHAGYAACAAIPFEDFAREHAGLLEALHQDVLAGGRSVDEARIERFHRLLAWAGVPDAEAAAAGAARRYRARYVAERRAIDGAAALLAALRQDVPVAVVSNNVRDEQVEKLQTCGLAPHVDVLVVSEEAGVSKPDPAIFRLALQRLGCEAADAVMVGDSWHADILGARAAGLPAVWFNPAGMAPPDPDVPVLRSLLPVAVARQAIVDAHRR